MGLTKGQNGLKSSITADWSTRHDDPQTGAAQIFQLQWK